MIYPHSREEKLSHLSTYFCPLIKHRELGAKRAGDTRQRYGRGENRAGEPDRRPREAWGVGDGAGESPEARKAWGGVVCKVKVTQSCPTLWDPLGQNTGVGRLSLLQRTLPHPGIEPRSPALQVDSLPLNHQGNPRILEWVACPFSSGSSWPRNRTGVSWIAGRFFTNWTIRESQKKLKWYLKTTHPQISSSDKFYQKLKEGMPILHNPSHAATIFLM